MESTSLNNDGPDYASYSLKELEDVLINIDKARFPDRYAQAKALYDEKRSRSATEHESTMSTSPVIRNWSEFHSYTRTVFIVFMILLAGGMVGLAFDFMTAKNWTANTAVPKWITGLSLVVLWFMALGYDREFAQYLSNTVRGKIAIVAMPFTFLILNFIFIEQGLPLGLHFIASKSDAEETMHYKATDGKKYCRHRIEVLENRELESTYLCLNRAQQYRLPQKGEVLIRGKRSAFGLFINGFTFQSRQ